MLQAYVPIFLFILIAIGFAAFTIIFSKLLHPKKYNKVKLEPYECGIEATSLAHDTRFSVRYFLIAVLFVVFDVETIFLFPWAIMFNRLGLFGLIEMLVFLVILVIGYIYVWKRKALDWA
jgi:NADH-quinone oxidoreductase subunit A